MKEVFSILFGAGFTIAVSLALGSLLLGAGVFCLLLPLVNAESGGLGPDWWLFGKALTNFAPNLDPVTRQNLIDRAGTEVLRRANLAHTQAARAELAERRATAVQSNDIMKQVVDAAVTPEGVPDELMAKAEGLGMHGHNCTAPWEWRNLTRA